MLNEMPKKLILVGNKETDVYCEYLSMLISTKDDIKHQDSEEVTIKGIKDGSVDTAIWTNEIYRDNRAHTSSRQKILFIGDDGCAENVIKNISFHDEEAKEFGIYYGWLGNKAVIYIDGTLCKDEKKYKAFFEEYEKLNQRYNEKVLSVAKKKNIPLLSVGSAGVSAGVGAGVGAGAALAGVLAPGMLAIGAIVAGGMAVKDGAEHKAKVKDQAYRYAVLKFYLDYLASFME